MAEDQKGSFSVPAHIAIIMDGNGRWAKQRGLPRNAGHRQGARVFENICGYCQKIGVKYVTAYAFSTENWKRPQSRNRHNYGTAAQLSEGSLQADKAECAAAVFG